MNGRLPDRRSVWRAGPNGGKGVAMRGRRVLAAVLMIVMLGPVVAAAQEDKPEFQPLGLSGIPFSFGPVGARALGMGNAFIGIADDATAAEANPAGLTILTRPEISVQGRYSDYEVQTADILAVQSIADMNFWREQAGAPPLGVNDELGNAFTGDPFPTLSDDSTNVAFASYVQPYSLWVLSLYYQQSTAFKGQSTFSAYNDVQVDLYETTRQFDATLESYGASIAVLLTEHVAFGFGVRQTTLDVTAIDSIRISYYNDIEFDIGLQPGASLADVRGLDLDDEFDSSFILEDDDSDITFNAGLLFNPNGTFSVGLVYKTGGEYRFDARLAQGLRVRAPSQGVEFEETAEEAFSETIEVPDFAGIGLAWRVSERLMISFDADWIEYSVLQSGLFDDPETPDFVRQQLEEVDDEIEYHLGLEYTFFLGQKNLPLSLRAGAWTDNDHDGIAAIDSDQIHYTAGVGWAVTEGFQIDLAAHVADTVTEGLLSLVYRF